MEMGNGKNKCEEEVEIYKDNEKELLMLTPEQIEEILKLANIKSEEVAPIVQTLYTSVSFDNLGHNLKVLELDEHLLQSLEVGDCVSFRGDQKEPAVLCTANRTYEVKEAETSNTCLLLPNLKFFNEASVKEGEGRSIKAVEVKGIYNTYLEVRECSPKLSKLQILLESSSFKGLEYEKLIDPSTLYDWDRLRNEIQASDGEILTALPEYLICCMDGYYRTIAFEFEARAMPLMLDLIEENSWKIDEINKEVSFESLKEIIPKPVFDLLFQKYTQASTKTADSGVQLYKYDKAKSSRLLAHILLTASPSNNYNDFMEAWKIGCPDCITPKEEYLYGTAIVTWNSQTMKKEVILYPEENLSDNIHKRLSQLFNVKGKWTVPEITPYISKFITSKQDVNAILTKYARPSTVNGVKYYSAKHGK